MVSTGGGLFGGDCCGTPGVDSVLATFVVVAVSVGDDGGNDRSGGQDRVMAKLSNAAFTSGARKVTLLLGGTTLCLNLGVPCDVAWLLFNVLKMSHFLSGPSRDRGAITESTSKK